VVVARLRAALAAEGLHLVRPLTPGALERAGVPWRLGEALPGGAGAVVVGDGGGDFFVRFRARGEAATADPLDGYTARVVRAAVSRALVGLEVAHQVKFPFSTELPWLPIQRLGEAAGLPPAGPLGLQVHPGFGPWWGYRALVVLSCEVPEEPPLPSPCAGCPAPCVAACPGRAVSWPRFSAEACGRHRAGDPGCHLSCAARLRCPVGAEHRYPDDQLAFHMRASLRMLSRPGA
jgi:ferredoxin